MAIVEGNAATVSGGLDTSPVDVTYTAQAGDDYLAVRVSLWDSAPPTTWITGVTLDPGGSAIALTQDITANNQDGAAEVWYLSGSQVPTSGTQTIRVSHNARVAIVHVRALQGAADQAPEVNNSSTGGASSISTSVTTLTDGAYVVDAMGNRDLESLTVDASQTEDYNVDHASSTTTGAGSHEVKATAGSVSMDWTNTSIAVFSHVVSAIAPASGGTTQNVTATLAGTSTDSVGSIILNLTGTTTLAGTSTTGGAITTTELIALTATLAGTSSDTAAVSLKQAITATLAGMSVDGGAVSIKDVVALAATLAGTSEDSAKVSLGPLVPGTYTTYDAVGIREDLQGKARGRSMSKRALETAEQQLNDLLNNR